MSGATTKAALPVVYEQNEQTLVEAAARGKGLTIKGLDDRAGYEAVHAARMTLKNLRVEIEKQRKALKEDSLDWGRRVDTEAKRLTAIVEPTERELEAQEKRIDDERARLKAEAEAAKRAKMDARVAAFAAVGVQAPPSAIADLSDADYEQMLAHATKEHAERVEQQRIAAEQAAFEQAARDAEAQAARQAEKERLDRERAEVQRLRDEAAEERKRLDADRKALDDARAKAEAQDRAREQEQLEAAERAKAPPPNPEPIRCATFGGASIPADVRARMDADRAAAELEADRPRRHCCLIGCIADAEYEIHDARDRSPDSVCSTDACSDHVGALLGTSEHLPAELARQPSEWIVRPIAAEGSRP